MLPGEVVPIPKRSSAALHERLQVKGAWLCACPGAATSDLKHTKLTLRSSTPTVEHDPCTCNFAIRDSGWFPWSYTNLIWTLTVSYGFLMLSLCFSVSWQEKDYEKTSNLVGGLVAIFYFPIYWVSNHPNFKFFQRGGPTTNQQFLQFHHVPSPSRRPRASSAPTAAPATARPRASAAAAGIASGMRAFRRRRAPRPRLPVLRRGRMGMGWEIHEMTFILFGL